MYMPLVLQEFYGMSNSSNDLKLILCIVCLEMNINKKILATLISSFSLPLFNCDNAIALYFSAEPNDGDISLKIRSSERKTTFTPLCQEP